MMENIVKSAVIFAAGVSIGATVAWRFLKAKYARIAQEEIDSVKEIYSAKESKIKKVLSEADVYKTKDNLVDESTRREYSKVVYGLGYTSTDEKKEVKEDKVLVKPYVISPDELGEKDYSIVSLNYYADGVLADDFDVVIDDVENTVGEDSLTHFGEYEDDSVFVRNDERELDYEILKDMRRFEDIPKESLYPGDDE